MKYEYRTTFTYLGKRYVIRAHTLEELYAKKALRKKELEENIIIYDRHVSVDEWAVKAFDTYKQNTKNLCDIKARYKKYVSPYIGLKPIGTIKAIECQMILNNCSGMSFSHCAKLKQELSFIFEKAVENVKPHVEVKSRRVGGANYQVPIDVAPERQVALAIRWITTYSQAKKGKPMMIALATELLDAFDNTGSSVKKKDDTHKMAQANKAFAHYRW